MKKNPHLLFQKEAEAHSKFRYGQRYPANLENESELDEEINDFEDKVKVFKYSMRQFRTEYDKRASERVEDVVVPQEIISIEIQFHGLFKSNDFEIRYLEDFGLVPVSYFDFNTKGLFVVANKEAFNSFWLDLKNFTQCKDHNNPNYNKNLIFIKDFKFHTTANRLRTYNNDESIAYLELVDPVLMNHDFVKPSSDAICQFLDEQNIEYAFNSKSLCFEMKNAPDELIVIIARNFDAIQSVNSYRHLVTFPNRFGLNVKEYPFEIKGEDALPIVGVIDTGVSIDTPLANILVNKDASLALNGMNPMVDEADEGYGHGTSVAALAALGARLSNGFETELKADAKILSLKILDGSSGSITNSDVINLIRRVCEDPELDVKLFTLTINYEACLTSNCNVSEYAYQLDNLAYEYDILIFISTANQGTELNWDNLHEEYPVYFKKSCSNLKSPAESMNNITIGSVGDNFEKQEYTEAEYPFSREREPAPYTRKHHLIQAAMKKRNANLIKPDAVFSGGNFSMVKWEFDNSWIIEPSGVNAMKVLSANKNDILIEQTGTSLSAPLVANLAAKILKKYPKLKAQTIKALLINSTDKITKTDTFSDFKDSEFKTLVGHGIPNEEKCLNSNENSATLIIEEKINVDECKSFKLYIPKYLNDVQKQDSLLRFELTVCYSFKPMNNNHIAYCPININCGVFKNVPLEYYEKEIIKGGRKRKVYKGITGAKKEYYAFSSGWSQYQDGMDKSKMLSNVQNLKFYAKRTDIINEGNCFKIAVGSHFHTLLPEFVTEILPQEYDVSIVIRITDGQNKSDLEGKLYDEIKLINDLDVVATSSLEGDLEAEL